MASASAVPSGWCAIRSDFAHFCKVHAARGLRARLRMLCASRAFWGLAVYRFGRWVYALRRGPLTLPLRLVYLALFEIGRLITKTSLNVGSRIESEVWIAPRGEVFISVGSRVGRGSMLHGCNTLGIGGRSRARGHPQLGERVLLAPGACAVGPLEVPDGCVIAANTLLGRSLPQAGGWAGVPPKPVAASAIQIPAPLRSAARGGRRDGARVLLARLEGGPGTAPDLPPGRKRADALAVRADARRLLGNGAVSLRPPGQDRAAGSARRAGALGALSRRRGRAGCPHLHLHRRGRPHRAWVVRRPFRLAADRAGRAHREELLGRADVHPRRDRS